MPSNTIAHYKQVLRDATLKATQPRLSVLQVLEQSDSPLSITDIQTRLKSHSPDTATLYRIVQQLKDKGLLLAVNMQHNHAHYELASKQHHHHIICTSCNKVVDLKECLLETSHRKLKSNKDFAQITEHSLEFFGLCNSCHKKHSKQ